MKKTHILPAALLAFGLASPALAKDTVSTETESKTKMERDASGNYVKKQTRSAESTDIAGTKTRSETKVEVETDADGDAKRKVITETSTDPKGLMNKTKTVTTDTVKYEDGKVEKKYQKKVDGKVVEEDKQETTTN